MIHPALRERHLRSLAAVNEEREDGPTPQGRYRPIEGSSIFGRLMTWIARPGKGELDLAFGARPRSEHRVGLLRRATFDVGGTLFFGVLVGVFVSFYRGRIGETDPNTYWMVASIGIRATLTFVALILPLLVALTRRRRFAERDHSEWLHRGRRSSTNAPFVPDPRSQPRPGDIGVAVIICLVLAVPIWALR